MQLLQQINDFSLKPIMEAAPTVVSKRLGLNKSFSDTVKVRFLFLAQVMVSLIAIPLLLITGLVLATLGIYNNQETESIEEMWGYIKIHLILVIPTAEVGIAAPWATTVRIALAQIKWLGKSSLPSELQFSRI